MAKPGRASQAKRGREKAKQEKRKEKLERRAVRKQEKTESSRPEGIEDPDLAGIVPGPQPIQE
jgi:hypothetical protein